MSQVIKTPEKKGDCMLCAYPHAMSEPHRASNYFHYHCKMSHGRAPKLVDYVAHLSFFENERQAVALGLIVCEREENPRYEPMEAHFMEADFEEALESMVSDFLQRDEEEGQA